MLRILTLLLLLAASLFPIAAFAQSPFDGTWKIDVSTARISQKPTGLLVQDGIYQCTTCTPSLKIAADGNDHPVTGDPYYDHRAIQGSAITPFKPPTKKMARSSALKS